MRRDANRWRRLAEFARTSAQVRQVRALLSNLRQQPKAGAIVGDRTLEDWLTWAETRAAACDPLDRGAAALFEEIADVTEWTYRD